MNVSTWNSRANGADVDFGTFSIADAVDIAEFWEMVAEEDVYMEDE